MSIDLKRSVLIVEDMAIETCPPVRSIFTASEHEQEGWSDFSSRCYA